MRCKYVVVVAIDETATINDNDNNYDTKTSKDYESQKDIAATTSTYKSI